MADFKNEFSWSKSRDEKFRTCPRQYYFYYYGSWGGWDQSCEKRTREIYVLKQLKSRKMWAGEKVHDCIKKSLLNLSRSIEPMQEQQAIDTTLNIMRNEYLNSKRGDYWKNPKSCSLFEHEYGLDLPDQVWKENADHVTNCLANFYRSDVYKMIRGLSKDKWLEVEEFSHFMLEGTKIHVVLDFSCRREDQILIYDWKTGRADGERNQLQLACYSLYALDKWKVDPSQVVTVEFNLSKANEHRYELEAADLKSISNHIQGAIRDMKKLLENQENNEASEDAFSFVEDERVCNYCNFKKICAKWA